MYRQCPYVAGHPVGNTPAFVGRVDVLREVLSVLSDPQENSILLHGQRRMGKTSILQELQARLSQGGFYYPVLFDLQDKARVPLEQVLEELADKISEVLGQKKPHLGTVPETTFREIWLPKVLNHLPTDKSLVLLFDEFDAFAEIDSEQAGAAFFPYLRDLLSMDPKHLNFVFVIGRNVDDFNKIGKSLFKGTRSKRVSLLKKEESIQLIRLSEKTHTLNWVDDAVEQVWQLTNGHPFMTQRLCRSIWEALDFENPNAEILTATVDRVENTIPSALESVNSSLEWLWEGLHSAERVLTSALAEAGTSTRIISENQLKLLLDKKVLKEGAIEKLQKQTLPRLLDWDLIEEVGGESYRFRVELLRRWFADYKPLSRLQDELAQVQDKSDIKEKADIHYKAGSEFYKKGKRKEAMTQLRQAVLSNPFHKEASQLLADILKEEKQYQEAMDILEGLYKYQPTAARERLISVLLILAAQVSESEHGLENDEALKFYKRVLELDAEEPEAKTRWQEIWQRRGNDTLGVIKNEDDFEHALDQVSDQVLDNALECYQEGKLYEPAKKMRRNNIVALC